MNEFLKMDIFFVVATLALVVLVALIGFVIYRVLRILKNVERVSDIVVDESKSVRQDIVEFRTYVREQGMGVKQVLALIQRKVRKMRGK